MRMHGRTHRRPDGGLILCAVAEGNDGFCEAGARFVRADGGQLEIRISDEECSYYQDVAAARRAVDAHIRTTGHTCSGDCTDWTPPATEVLH
jgi:hypothetical protein